MRGKISTIVPEHGILVGADTGRCPIGKQEVTLARAEPSDERW